MEIRDDHGVQRTSLILAFCSHSTHYNHIKLSEIDIGKLTEKAQLSTRHSNKVLATKWRQQRLTRDYTYRVSEKLL